MKSILFYKAHFTKTPYFYKPHFIKQKKGLILTLTHLHIGRTSDLLIMKKLK